jgi:hypothetical protein
MFGANVQESQPEVGDLLVAAGYKVAFTRVRMAMELTEHAPVELPTGPSSCLRAVAGESPEPAGSRRTDREVVDGSRELDPSRCMRSAATGSSCGSRAIAKRSDSP